MSDGSDRAQGSVQQEPEANVSGAEMPDVTAPLAVPQTPSSRGSSSGWWTLPLLAGGIAIIACAMIVAQAEENRQMSWQRNKLQVDVEHLRKQVEVNQDFLDRLGSDDALVERLAQRQMKLVREGSAALELKGSAAEVRSPFTLIRVPPPPEVQPYGPAQSTLAQLFGTPRQRIYAVGLGALLIAASLILGASAVGTGTHRRG